MRKSEIARHRTRREFKESGQVLFMHNLNVVMDYFPDVISRQHRKALLMKTKMSFIAIYGSRNNIVLEIIQEWPCGK